MVNVFHEFISLFSCFVKTGGIFCSAPLGESSKWRRKEAQCQALILLTIWTSSWETWLCWVAPQHIQAHWKHFIKLCSPFNLVFLRLSNVLSCCRSFHNKTQNLSQWLNNGPALLFKILLDLCVVCFVFNPFNYSKKNSIKTIRKPCFNWIFTHFFKLNIDHFNQCFHNEWMIHQV